MLKWLTTQSFFHVARWKWIAIVTVIVVIIVLCVVLIKPAASASAPIPPPTDRVVGLDYDTGILTTTVPAEIRACILDDFTKIKDAGYNTVRTYFPIFGFNMCTPGSNEGLYASIAQEVGIQVLLGVNQDLYETYKPCIVQQIQDYPDQVLGVTIGNESVQDGNWGIAATIISHATDLRASIAPATIRVGTAQQGGFGCSFTGNCTSLCPIECQNVYHSMEASLDFMGFNIYPGTAVGGPAICSDDEAHNANATIAQIEALIDSDVGAKLFVTESGCPHAGQCPDGEGNVITYTTSIQSNLVNALHTWQDSHLTTPLFLFMSFDVPSKTNTAACAPYSSGEKFFGVLENQLCPRSAG